MAEQAELAKLAGSQHHVIQKLHVTTGLGVIPTVALEVLGADQATRGISSCPSGENGDMDIYELIALTINEAIEVADVKIQTLNTATMRRCGIRQERITIRVSLGSLTTTNIGAIASDPFQAFALAYVRALNCLFHAFKMMRTVELEGVRSFI